MDTIGTLPGDRLAGLSADLFHKVQKGIISLDELALFNQRKDPFGFTFERNEHGHIVLTFKGVDLTGEWEAEKLKAAEFHVNNVVKSCLLSADYDKNHRLVAGQRYKIALMPTREIEHDSDRTTDALRTRGIEKYGYEKPLAGIVLRIRESVSNKQMEEMGFGYIAGANDSIKDSDGNPHMLLATRRDGGWLYAVRDDLDGRWYDFGAVAFLAR